LRTVKSDVSIHTGTGNNFLTNLKRQKKRKKVIVPLTGVDAVVDAVDSVPTDRTVLPVNKWHIKITILLLFNLKNLLMIIYVLKKHENFLKT
jgi:hypothetical protein